MKQMTPTEIRQRLVEIEKSQEAHAARDFDAELLEVMKSGGDVDALEEQHLEAERQGRRLRVERQALEAALPDAVRAEAEKEVEVIKERMADQPDTLRSLAEKIEPLAAKLEPLLIEARELFKTRVLQHQEVQQVKAKNKLPDSVLEGTGNLVCHSLERSKHRLQEAMGHGLDLSNQRELMRYSTGLEFQQFAVTVDESGEDAA